MPDHCPALRRADGKNAPRRRRRTGTKIERGKTLFYQIGAIDEFARSLAIM
jgi:hypothetical protein